MKKTMKLSMIAWIMLIGFTACSDKDNDDLSGEQQKEALVGKWAWGNITIGDLPNTHVHLCDTKKDYLEFKADNTTSDVTYGEDCEEDKEDGTYTMTGNNIKLTGEYNVEGTFQISGTKLTIEYEAEVGPGSPLFPHVLVFERL